MKKRFILIVFLSIITCGCSVTGFDISNITVHGSYIKGTIKNSSGKDCNTIRVDVTLKNGSIKTDGFAYISKSLKDEETYQFDELLILNSNDSGNIDDLSGYNVKVINIECTD